MRYILVYARQRVFVVGGWNTVKFNILPCSFICHWLQGSIFSRGKDIYFYLFLFFDSTVQENDGEFTSYRLASDKKFLSENDEISPRSSLMLGLLAKKICGLYLKQEKSYQQIKTSQYFPRPLYSAQFISIEGNSVRLGYSRSLPYSVLVHRN